MTIYLDVIWLLNFLFDSLLLLLTAVILKRTYSIWRLLCGGFIGSFIILLSITPIHAYSSHSLSKLLFSVLMVWVTFGYKRFRYFAKSLMTLYFVTFLLGGSIMGAHYFLNFDIHLSAEVAYTSLQGFGDPVSWLFVLIGFPVAWHFSKARIEGVEIEKIQYDQLVGVEIFLQEGSYQFTGLVDSGNQLYDPIDKSPVMIVSLKRGKGKMPLLLSKLLECSKNIVDEQFCIPDELVGKIRMIPCQVVGQDHQLMVALKPDKVVVTWDEKIIVADKVLVSVTEQQLSADGAFQCIVHPKILTGGRKMPSACSS